MVYLVRRQLVVAALLICGTAAWAQSPAETTNPASFIKKAALMNLVELEMGKVAEERASNAEIKAFAHHVVTGHTEAQAELIAAAKLAPAVLPTETEPSEAARRQELVSKTGVQFDRAYIDHVVTSHEEAEAFLLDAAAHQVDPALKRWATATTAIVQGHLKEARRLRQLVTAQSR